MLAESDAGGAVALEAGAGERVTGVGEDRAVEPGSRETGVGISDVGNAVVKDGLGAAVFGRAGPTINRNTANLGSPTSRFAPLKIPEMNS